MEAPNLTRIVECHVPIREGLETHLRLDVLPNIRHLQASGRLRWFSFLIHGPDQLVGDVAVDVPNVIHLRLEPAIGLTIEAFSSELPEVFRQPVHVDPLGRIAGVELSTLRSDGWIDAWRLVGESAEWVLCFLETHADNPPPVNLAQFMHFITNAMGLGFRCRLELPGQPLLPF